MTLDSSDIEREAVIESDVCIIGGGVAGLTVARELAGSPLRVCLLESGGARPEPHTQQLDAGENVGFPYYPLNQARSRSLGGSSTMWHVPCGGDGVGARMRPLDPIDFERRDWVPFSGWPFGKDHLDPYYARAQKLCRIEPASFEPDEWSGTGPFGLLALGEGVQTVIYKVGRRDVFEQEYPKEVTAAANITTVLHATVLEIECTEAADRVARLRIARRGEGEFFVRARTFILALGGLETPRLLLVSNRRHTTGVGNEHDLVGRFFMEHLHFWSGLLVPEDTALFDRTLLYTDFHRVNGVAIVGKLALTEPVLRRERLLNQNVQLMGRERPDPFRYRRLSDAPVESAKSLLRGAGLSDAPSHLRNVASGWRDLATLIMRRARGPLPTRPVFVLANMTEQVPNPESRVTLGDEMDQFGLRRVRLDWRITRQDVDSVCRTQRLLGAAFERAGIARFFQEMQGPVPPASTHGGYHHMGTTRMHVDPRQGVVDADGRVHGMRNLYVAGPSVFPTGGYANPVLTTMALSLRLADHVRSALPRTSAAA